MKMLGINEDKLSANPRLLKMVGGDFLDSHLPFRALVKLGVLCCGAS